MKLEIVNSGTKEFPFYQIMDGKNEFCATDNIENAEKIVKLCTIPQVINWVAVKDQLPKEEKFRMSADVLTIAGDKMSVKCYDYELCRWSGSPHVTVKYWMELPKPPCL